VIGFLVVLLSSVFFCFQNVTVRLLFKEHTILGVFQIGGFVTPSLQNSFLLMGMRMLVVVPLMAFLAPKLHPSTWEEIKRLHRPEHRSLLFSSIGCGLLMFCYLAMIYLAIGIIPTGIALTLFFTYPVFTALFSWRVFGDRPTRLRWGVMGLVFLGSFLTMPFMSPANSTTSWVGIGTGIASGISYAFYIVIAQKSFEKLHPVPFTWISFTTTLLLSGISLLFWQVYTAQLPWEWLWLGGSLSALFTFAGHLLNNFGIRLIGATSAAMVSAANPALTVVLAWLTIQETLSSLQLIGVLLVTLSIVLLSHEHRTVMDK
jgi:drug/metabolite transporter (DMT)-like permease